MVLNPKDGCKTFYGTLWWLKQESPAFRYGECQKSFIAMCLLNGDGVFIRANLILHLYKSLDKFYAKGVEL